RDLLVSNHYPIGLSPIGVRPCSVKMAGQSNLSNCNFDRWNDGVTPRNAYPDTPIGVAR
ncbi:hypothetical protein LY28_03782, partial [Ruminiclostridium sufflavum DSM 19573]